SILTDLQVTPTKPGRMIKPYLSHRFIANCFKAGNLKMEVKQTVTRAFLHQGCLREGCGKGDFTCLRESVKAKLGFSMFSCTLDTESSSLFDSYSSMIGASVHTLGAQTIFGALSTHADIEVVVSTLESESLEALSTDEAFSRQLKAELNANINWNDVIEQVKISERQNNAVMRYQALKRKRLTEAQEKKNIMIYLKNMAGFKMNFFKRMNYSEIRTLFEKHYNSNQAFLERVGEEVTIQEKEIKEEGNKRQGESLEQEIAKKKRMDEEAEELKRHLQIMANDDDDVYTEDTPLASKVPVVNYQIHHENNKPYSKIIKADRTHELFFSFITLLKNFNREDLETL
nr:hypothetical protein [Tanacetum cinerariifolium]